MKKNIFLAFALIITLGFSSCNVLEEDPRSSYDPTFFSTDNGVTGGLTALYSSLRDLYGQAYYYNSLETGTDEYTWAQSADGNFKVADMSGAGDPIKSDNCRSDVLWGMAFSYINTASGVIENGEASGMDPALVAEAYFFRAFYYFQLVQTFGGVPLDLGSGKLAFNTSPVRVSVRNTVPEVYEAIFSDLEWAASVLPETARITGSVTKNTARLVLAKAYLTYAWWLKNPNGIPTYPECTRDAGKAGEYFNKAYNTAMEAITNPGPYGLMDTYYDVNLAANDRNKEIMLYADHTEDSEQYNGGSLGYGGGGAPDNFVSWMGCWNYTQMVIKDKSGNNINPVQRDCVQALGRPWTRMAPVIEVFTKTFADKTFDSRYDGTFTYCFHANWQKAAGTADGFATEGVGANGLPIYPGAWGAFSTDVTGHNCGFGDAVLTFLNDETPGVDYSVNGAAVGGGQLPGRADFVINPSGISRIAYPVLWKMGPYRTNNGTGYGPGVNAGSTRPYPILKFSEFYFIAAEAKVMGASGSTSAYDLINVLRARAGKWRWDNNAGVAKSADYSSQMVAATPSNITIDYILDERSREYFGEGVRWLDLARTQTWEERASTYSICGATYGDHNRQTFTRTITKSHYLRPIPQGQLDGLEMSDAERAAYQNPGY